jgi:hypothetical protein
MTDIVVAPTISASSAAKYDLMAQTFRAAEAVDTARKALQAMSPQPADYASAFAHQTATEQNDARIAALEAVLRQLHAIATRLDKQ